MIAICGRPDSEQDHSWPCAQTVKFTWIWHYYLWIGNFWRHRTSTWLHALCTYVFIFTPVDKSHLSLHSVPQLLRNNTLLDSGITYASRETRRLMFRLTSQINIIPRCLRMTDIRTKMNLSALDVGDFGRVLEGEHNGQQVALTTLHKIHHEDVSIFPLFFPSRCWCIW